MLNLKISNFKFGYNLYEIRGIYFFIYNNIIGSLS